MLKRIARSCHRNYNFISQVHKNKFLPNILKRSAFFNFKQKEDEAKKNQEEDIQNMKNIAHLIKQVKENNKKLPTLLPQKDIKDQDKLTVVLEMDEVLLFCFYPDEFEGYLQSPLR
jgi:CTD small phosphatase-like protein 2